MTRLTKALAAIALTSLAAGAAGADEEESMTMLLNQALAGMDGKEVTVVQIDVPAGFETPRHLHPGHMFIYVLEGAVELDADGQPALQLAAGDAGYEVPGIPMTGRNMSATEGASLLIFAVGDAGTPFEMPAPE